MDNARPHLDNRFTILDNAHPHTEKRITMYQILFEGQYEFSKFTPPPTKNEWYYIYYPYNAE